jgi:hypothetical protein
VKFKSNFLKHALQKHQIACVFRIGFASLPTVDLKHTKSRPRVHGRIDVAERPFVRGQLAVRVHIPFACEQEQLRFGKFGINFREADAMERQVPRGKPRIFPFVGHGNDIRIVQVFPITVATAFAFRWRGRLRWVASQPKINVVMKKLFTPNQSGESLALDEPRIDVGNFILQCGIKFVCFPFSLRKTFIEVRPWFLRRGLRFLQPQSHCC